MKEIRFSKLTIVKFKANFTVKCIDDSRTQTLTVNRKYKVIDIGFNGYYKVKGNTGRYVWHKPNRFKKQ
jgi:hypothetical protein